MPRMSVSLTLDAVRRREKTVTRRHVDTWKNLKAGDRLTLIEKGMGLPKGAKQVVVCEVEIVSVRVEPLRLLSSDVRYGRQELALEGFPDSDPDEWVRWWALTQLEPSHLAALEYREEGEWLPAAWAVRTIDPCWPVEIREATGEGE